MKDSILIDVPNMCYIRIQKEDLAGEKKDILKAVKSLKYAEPANYKSMCKTVNNIVIGQCIMARKDSPKITYINTVGCYIKGSRSIFINTKSHNPDYTTDEIKAAIIKYSQECKKFWDSVKST
jgi:hypothetical protein